MSEKNLRQHLADYYGTAAFNGNPAALADLANAETASNDELMEMAYQLGIKDKEEKGNG